MEDQELQKLLREKFPIARIENSRIEYTEAHYKKAESRLIDNEIERFTDIELIIRSFACLFFTARKVIEGIKLYAENKTAEQWAIYHKGLQHLADLYLRFIENSITEISFKGTTNNLTKK